MITADDNNLTYAESQGAVDKINGSFYAKFPYPWPPGYFDRLGDPSLESVMLNQSIGNWRRLEIAPSRIWVAGCGTNQAVFTALKFPNARVIGTDLSVVSLETAAHSARQLGLDNLELQRRSINDSDFRDEFDYVICTGVIHHNADPQKPLRKLHAALRSSGICELMVYNRYHRIWTTAFQKAVQVLSGTLVTPDFDAQMDVTKRLMRTPIDSTMSQMVALHKDLPEAGIADGCMQPVEHSYTVMSLNALLNDSGFEILAPVLNQFDKTSGHFIWNMTFQDPELQRRHEALPDLQRWQVNNLLLFERSPHLWFYLQRTDSGRTRKSEMQICNDFLDSTFRRVNVERKVFVRREDGSYAPSPKQHSYPTAHPDALCKALLAAQEANPQANMRTLFKLNNVDTDFSSVQRLRLQLTTCAYPYMTAVDLAA
jgi:SAM-dependent methyltransferase